MAMEQLDYSFRSLADGKREADEYKRQVEALKQKQAKFMAGDIIDAEYEVIDPLLLDNVSHPK